MLVKEWVDIIENLYNFSQRIGNEPEWIDEGNSFREKLAFEEKVIIIERHIFFINLTAPLLTLDSLDDDLREKAVRLFMQRNIGGEDVVYYGLSQDGRQMVLSSKIVLSPDMEATLGHYLMVRNSMLKIFENVEDDLKAIQ